MQRFAGPAGSSSSSNIIVEVGDYWECCPNELLDLAKDLGVKLSPKMMAELLER